MSRSPGSLSLFDLLCLGVNAIVGSGIYAFPGLLAGMLGPASFLAFVVSGLACLLVALCVAEAAGMYECSGGPYIYARAAFGDQVGYLVGWTCWAAAVVSWAAVSRALMPYLGDLWAPLGQGASGVAAATVIVAVLAVVNYRGIKPGAYTADVLTVAKLLPLLVLVGVGLFALDPAQLSPFAPRGLAGLPRAAFIAFFAFQGFEVVPVPAGESTNPRRNVPAAVIGSLLGSTLLYVLVQIVAVATTPGLSGAEQPIAEMGKALLGEAGGRLVAVAAVVSMLGFCAGVALSAPRYVSALADDGFLPALLCRLHPRFGSPGWAIVATSALTALLVALLDFSRLVDLSVLTVAVQYLATCSAVPVLRWRQPRLPRSFRVPLVVAPLAVLVVLALVGVQLIEHTRRTELLLSFGVMLLVGIALAAAVRLARR